MKWTSSADPGEWIPALPTFEQAILTLVEILAARSAGDAPICLGPQAVWADPAGLYLVDAGAFRFATKPPSNHADAGDVRQLIEIYLDLWGRKNKIPELVSRHLSPGFWTNWDNARGFPGVCEFIHAGRLRLDPEVIRWRRWLAVVVGRLRAHATAHPEDPLATSPWALDQNLFDPTTDLRAGAAIFQVEPLPDLPDPVTRPNDAVAALGKLAEIAQDRWLRSRRWVWHLWHAVEQVIRQRDLAHFTMSEGQLQMQKLEKERSALVERVGRLETANDQLRRQTAGAEQQRDMAVSDRERYRATAEQARAEAGLASQRAAEVEQQLRQAEFARDEAATIATQARTALTRRKAEQKATNENILDLASEIVGGLAVPPRTRIVALLIDIGIVTAVGGLLLGVWRRAWPEVSFNGVTVGEWVVAWPALAWMFVLVLASRSIISPGRWLTGVYPLRILRGKPVESLDTANKLLAGLFQYAPVVAALWYAASVAPSTIDTSGFIACLKSLGATAGVAAVVAAWLVLNVVVMAAHHSDEDGSWFRGSTLIERYLLGIGFSRCRVDEMERFTRLTAFLSQDAAR